MIDALDATVALLSFWGGQDRKMILTIDGSIVHAVRGGVE